MEAPAEPLEAICPAILKHMLAFESAGFLKATNDSSKLPNTFSMGSIFIVWTLQELGHLCQVSSVECRVRVTRVYVLECCKFNI